MKGKILGSRYQLLEYIAEGGFGKTYLAQDIQIPGKDLCVVKQLAPSFDTPNLLAIARRLFKTEAATLHNLGHHPQIPELLAYFEEAGKFYLVQQYIQGQTLDRELSASAVWSTTEVIDLLRDCLNILQFIHEQRVIHRDIKPANLIRRYTDQKIVLVDFGSVKNVLQEQTSLIQLTVGVGTQGYMPIEQARGKPRASSDLYALGIIAIEALTGVKSLNLEEDEEGELVWWNLVDAPLGLKAILAKMTKCNYKHRYQSAQSILNTLESCIQTTITIPSSAIAVKQPEVRQLQAVLTENQSTYQPKTNQDPNALPGVRSVVMVTDLDSQLTTRKITKQRLWKIAVGIIGIIIVITSGIYFSRKRSAISPNADNLNSENTLQVK